MINNLSNIIGMKVKKLFLVVWPPYGEKDKSQIDISVGCVFENDQDRLFIISTDVNDLTIPLIKYQSIPKNYFA